MGVLDSRDPFCIAEDNGLLSFVRTDQPFWTGARPAVMNSLLWGLLTAPSGDIEVTELGRAVLEEVGRTDA